MSTWITFCRDFASVNKIAYGEAMKSQACKDLYHKTKNPVKKQKLVENEKALKLARSAEKASKLKEEKIPTPPAPKVKKVRVKKTALNLKGEGENITSENEPSIVEQFEARVYAKK